MLGSSTGREGAPNRTHAALAPTNDDACTDPRNTRHQETWSYRLDGTNHFGHPNKGNKTSATRQCYFFIDTSQPFDSTIVPRPLNCNCSCHSYQDPPLKIAIVVVDTKQQHQPRLIAPRSCSFVPEQRLRAGSPDAMPTIATTKPVW